MQNPLSMSKKLSHLGAIRILKLLKELPSKDKVGSTKTHASSEFTCHFYSKPVSKLGFEYLLC
jgi:hypothetical protein